MKQPNYTDYALFYDEFELAGFAETDDLNIFLDEVFKLNSIKTVLDFACGTGGQAIGLAKKGYKVTGVDLNQAMLDKATSKYASRNLCFELGDMRSSKHGTFDAVISIFNAIGHLTVPETMIFFKNAFEQLNNNGLFVVDIFNLAAMENGNFSEYEYLEKEIELDGRQVHHVRKCNLNVDKSQISIFSRTYAQDGVSEPIIIEDAWVMQIYRSTELKSMLKNVGFKEIYLFGRTGNDFDDKLSDTIMAVCQK